MYFQTFFPSVRADRKLQYEYEEYKINDRQIHRIPVIINAVPFHFHQQNTKECDTDCYLKVFLQETFILCVMSFYLLRKTTFAGFPWATAPGGIFPVTTDPAEMIDPFPMRTPSRMVTLVAIQTFSSTTMGPVE